MLVPQSIAAAGMRAELLVSIGDDLLRQRAVPRLSAVELEAGTLLRVHSPWHRQFRLQLNLTAITHTTTTTTTGDAHTHASQRQHRE